jgi:hypothetical protein
MMIDHDDEDHPEKIAAIKIVLAAVEQLEALGFDQVMIAHVLFGGGANFLAQALCPECLDEELENAKEGFGDVVAARAAGCSLH